MSKRTIGLLAAGLLLLWILPLAEIRVAITQDCSVQIISVSLNKSTLSIGEPLQVNITYNLLYDSQDPLAIGVVTVSVGALGEEEPILSREYLERGTNIRKTTTLAILPDEWEPNETGQVGLVKVSGWVQDSYESMTDYAERDFTIVRSKADLILQDTPSKLVFHDQFVLQARLSNGHNTSIVVANHPIRIEIGTIQGILQAWDLRTLTDGTVAQAVQTECLGTGIFTCNVTSRSDGDYLQTSAQFCLEILKASLLLVAQMNASAYLAYYPGMNNCTALLTASLACSSQMHDVSQANVTWTLGGNQGVLQYAGAQRFTAEVPMPQLAGQYTIAVRASLPNHNWTDALLPVIVNSREPILSLVANRTQAAYCDPIELCVRAVDKTCSRPLVGKQVSIYIFFQDEWIPLASGALDGNGELMTTWKAQDLGDARPFSFSAILHGVPEFYQVEASISVENTQNLRFFAASRLAIIRGKPANLTIQITTLESMPIPNLGVELVELLTNQTWCSTTTNASGYAYFAWNTPSGYELGEHRFLVTAIGSAGIRGAITVLLATYDGTVLRLV
jgi:hypothetical protein